MGDLEVELMTWGGARDKFVFRDFYQIVLDFEDHGGLELSATFLKGGPVFTSSQVHKLWLL